MGEPLFWRTEAERHTPVASFHGIDVSDKTDDETWIEYWDRRRHDIHGPDCECILCLIDKGEVPAPPPMPLPEGFDE
jgi:hypothetical protein